MKNLMRRILVFVVLVAIVFGLSPSVPTKAEESIDVTKEIEVQDYIEDFGFDGSYSDDREVETQDPFIGTITYKFHLDDLSFLSINFKPASYYRNEIDLKLYDSNDKLLLDYDKNPNDMAAGLNNKLLLLNGDYYIKVKSDSIPDNPNYNLGCYELNLIACKMKNIDDLMFNKWPTCYGTSVDFYQVIRGGTFTSVFGGGSAKALVYGETYGYTTTDIKAINPYKIKELSFSFNIKNSKSKAKITFSKETQAIRDSKSPSEVYSSTSSTSSTTKKTDTKKPTVKGVKNGKTYKKKVKFTVYDKSGIKKVTLNGKKISVKKAKKGYTVKKAKKYTLKVWDKKGNKRTVKFRIK